MEYINSQQTYENFTFCHSNDVISHSKQFILLQHRLFSNLKQNIHIIESAITVNNAKLISVQLKSYNFFQKYHRLAKPHATIGGRFGEGSAE